MSMLAQGTSAIDHNVKFAEIIYQAYTNEAVDGAQVLPCTENLQGTQSSPFGFLTTLYADPSNSQRPCSPLPSYLS